MPRRQTRFFQFGQLAQQESRLFADMWKNRSIFDTHHSLVNDYCCFNIFSCFPDVPAVPSIFFSIPQVSTAFFDVPTDSSAVSESPPESGAYPDTPSISGTGRISPCPFCHSRNMFLTPVSWNPPFPICSVATAFIRYAARLEDHVWMFLLKESRKAKPCSYLGCTQALIF